MLQKYYEAILLLFCPQNIKQEDLGKLGIDHDLTWHQHYK